MSDYDQLQEELRVANAYILQLGGTLPPPASARPPVNVDVPYVAEDMGVCTCTMGNWEGEPSAYAYQWKRDGAEDIGDGTASYTVDAADVGHSITCVVTATNAAGSMMAAPSNAVAITEPPATQSAESASRGARGRK